MVKDILKVELSKFLAEYEPYAKKYFDAKVKSTKKYSPLISQFYVDLADFSSRGKKMRAFLVYLGYQTGNQNRGTTSPMPTRGRTSILPDILPICLAFEMTQSFFLIHDDIIDNSTLRRGKPTIHKLYSGKFGDEYGRSMAIVLGDIACVELFELVNSADFDSDLKTKCISALTNTLLETAYGQTMDIDNAYRLPSFADVCKVTDLKAARYSFVGPLTLGAILCRARDVQMKAISEFGLRVGFAFQLQDDVLGVFGDEKVLGKSVLSDMQEGKNTPLIFKARILAKGADLDKLNSLWGKKDANKNDLEKVKVILKKSGALLWCREENRRLVDKAKKYIDKISIDDNVKQILASVADFAVAREK